LYNNRVHNIIIVARKNLQFSKFALKELRELTKRDVKVYF